MICFIWMWLQLTGHYQESAKSVIVDSTGCAAVSTTVEKACVEVCIHLDVDFIVELFQFSFQAKT